MKLAFLKLLKWRRLDGHAGSVTNGGEPFVTDLAVHVRVPGNRRRRFPVLRRVREPYSQEADTGLSFLSGTSANRLHQSRLPKQKWVTVRLCVLHSDGPLSHWWNRTRSALGYRKMCIAIYAVPPCQKFSCTHCATSEPHSELLRLFSASSWKHGLAQPTIRR